MRGLRPPANIYAYVLNDPMNLIDPSGEFFVPRAIGGAVVGAPLEPAVP